MDANHTVSIWVRASVFGSFYHGLNNKPEALIVRKEANVKGKGGKLLTVCLRYWIAAKVNRSYRLL